ncbi:hypothetical protein PMAYCL1PPCAC_33201, partial [Pristionchus mayeri]
LCFFCLLSNNVRTHLTILGDHLLNILEVRRSPIDNLCRIGEVALEVVGPLVGHIRSLPPNRTVGNDSDVWMIEETKSPGVLYLDR